MGKQGRKAVAGLGKPSIVTAEQQLIRGANFRQIRIFFNIVQKGGGSNPCLMIIIFILLMIFHLDNIVHVVSH